MSRSAAGKDRRRLAIRISKNVDRARAVLGSTRYRQARGGAAESGYRERRFCYNERRRVLATVFA